jgi:LCP family protein required for cell wall assembly
MEQTRPGWSLRGGGGDRADAGGPGGSGGPGGPGGSGGGGEWPGWGSGGNGDGSGSGVGSGGGSGSGVGSGGGSGSGGGGRSGRPSRHEHWSLHKKLLVWGSSALAGVLVLGAIGAGVVWHHLNGNIRTEDAQLKPSAMDGKQDILFIGSDSRAGANQALGGGDVEGARSDTVMVFDAPADRRQATEVSIPRDSMVQIPDCTGPGGQTVAANFGMFNSAFTEGGAPCTVRTVQSLTGLSLTHYIALDFEGVVGVVNALGGVKVCMTQAVQDKDSGLNLPAGVSTLNGKQALAFVRVRHSIGDGSDLERIQRQQYFLDQLEHQVRNAGLLSDPVRLYQVLDAATQSITTDPGLGNVTDLYNLAQTLNGIPTGRITYLTVPNSPYPDDPEQVVWTEPNATNLWNSLSGGHAGAPANDGVTAGASASGDGGSGSSDGSGSSGSNNGGSNGDDSGGSGSGNGDSNGGGSGNGGSNNGGGSGNGGSNNGGGSGNGGSNNGGSEASFATPAEQALSRLDGVMQLILLAAAPHASAPAAPGNALPPGGADVGTCPVP